jgi:hypothetical protein
MFEYLEDDIGSSERGRGSGLHSCSCDKCFLVTDMDQGPGFSNLSPCDVLPIIIRWQSASCGQVGRREHI